MGLFHLCHVMAQHTLAARNRDAALTLPRRTARLVVPGLVVVLAVVGYWTVFQGGRTDQKLLSTLIVENPELAGLKTKPSSAQVVPPKDTTWSEVQKAAKANPAQTGGYSTTWEGAKKTDPSLSILVELLPTEPSAQRLQQQILSDYTDAKSLKSQGIIVSSRFAVTAVPDGHGVSYKGSGSSGTASTGSTVVFRVGRVVAALFTQSPSSSVPNDGNAVRQEYALLQAREPGFSPSVATRSALATSVYFVIAFGVAAAAFVIPGLVRRARARRDAHEAARASRGRQGRGSKVLRRQKMSPLMQPARRPGRPSKVSSKR